MAIERLLSTQNQPLKRPVLVYLERLLLTQSGPSTHVLMARVDPVSGMAIAG